MFVLLPLWVMGFQLLPGNMASGGALLETQRVYDQKSVTLALTVDPDRQWIEGHAELELEILEPAQSIELELLPSLVVKKVFVNGTSSFFHRNDFLLKLPVPDPAPERLRVRVEYEGEPLVAKHPPWSGGFNWSRTDSGQPWVGVSCQGMGGKVWFPCKTHPSDNIEGLRLEVTVPEPLYCAANGDLVEILQAGEGMRTFVWESAYPISTYNVSINIADYHLTEGVYKGERDVPVHIYTLKEYQKADQVPGDSRTYRQKRKDLLQHTIDYLGFFAEFYGEYPFIEEKFGVVHTAYLGMEHQSINAYGNHFKIENGYDWLLFHEMGHEWWGNKVSVGDWADFWIHEGICTYTTAVFLEDRFGPDQAKAYFKTMVDRIQNRKAMVSGKGQSSAESHNPDHYFKGAMMLHSLRFLLGKQRLNQILKTFATTPEYTFGNKVDTADFIAVAENLAGEQLDWFFDVYLFRAELPVLKVVRSEQQLELAWDRSEFEMPVEIEITHKGKSQRIRQSMVSGKASLSLPKNAAVVIDPDLKVLKNLQEGVSDVNPGR